MVAVGEGVFGNGDSHLFVYESDKDLVTEVRGLLNAKSSKGD